MRVAVIGTGHVGLVTCATMASLGHEVVGTDADQRKIDMLHSGTMPFHEPGMAELVDEGLDSGRLTFTADLAQAVVDREVIFICVGTPPRASGEANLIAVEKAAQNVARNATIRGVIVEKSTVPAGTSTRVKRTLIREKPKVELEVASNPEFLREGKAVEDSLDPDRILVGAEAPWAFETMRRLYQPQIDRGVQLIETNIQTAELSKHACNAFLAMKISFANALAQLCERADADVVQVAEVMGSDARIGRAFLNAGLGYGGYCFPKDLAAFEKLAQNLGYDFGLLREVARINDEAVTATVQKVKDAVWNIEGKRIALLGLAFKPETDDTRLAPALALAQRLIDEGAEVVGYDPAAGHNAKEEVPGLEVVPDAYLAAAGSHCVVLCTEWAEFADLDLNQLADATAYPVFIDGRNMFTADAMTAAGFTYYPTGRAPAA